MSNANELQHVVDELKFKGLVKEILGENLTETITRFARTAPALSFLYLSEHTRSVIENAVKNVELCKECREITLDEACIIAIIRERTNFGAGTIAVYAKSIYESINKHPVDIGAAFIAASQIVSMMSNPRVGLLIETNDL